LIATSGAALATGPAQAEAVAFALGGASIAVATALRLGIAPLHHSAVRASDATPLALAPLVVAFAPAAFVVAAHSLIAVITPVSGSEAAWLAMGVRTAALAGIVLAAAGLLLQTGLERALPYAFAAEAAFVLLALVSASDPAVAAALRTRLLVMPLAAAAAWSAVAALRLDPRWVRDGLRGWARRAPALALTVVAATLALFGWPGSPSWEARETIAAAAFGPVLGAVALVASATPTVFALVRALVVGSRSPERRPEHGPRVRQARRRETWRMPLGAICALALAVLAIAVAAGAGDVAGAAAGSVAAR
jgi:NADH:ubiquinone oxidoreductase subunit 2 (subunit N)